MSWEWIPSSRDFVQWVRDARIDFGWSVERLARECADEGYPVITRAVLANLEAKRRHYVTLDEARVLTTVIDYERRKRVDQWFSDNFRGS